VIAVTEILGSAERILKLFVLHAGVQIAIVLYACTCTTTLKFGGLAERMSFDLSICSSKKREYIYVC
jgi:hypothetical protein